jgi:hypothetical protein
MASRVRVVDARLAELDRDGRAAILPDGSCLPYDYLVLATGLQDVTERKMGVTDAAGLAEALDVGDGDEHQDANGRPRLVMTPALRKGIRLCRNRGDADALCREVADAGGTQSVVVYGSGVEALCVVQALLKRRVRRLVLVRSAPAPKDGSWLGDKKVDDVMAETLEGLGVLLQHGQAIQGVRADPATGAVASARFTDAEGALQQYKCKLLVCCDKPDCDTGVFRAVNDCGLVYDGRLVVGPDLRTADPNVLAGGSLCKFSRRYRGAKPLAAFQSQEVGAALAQSLLRKIDPLMADPDADALEDSLAGAGSLGGPPPPLPTFRVPKCRSGTLPGGLHYCLATLPDGLPGRKLVTNKDDGTGAVKYCAVELDPHGRVTSICYLGA